MTSFYIGIAFILTWFQNHIHEPKDNQLSLLFIGDIMGHGPQIKAAFNDSSKTYSYENMFKYIKEEVSDADFTIANLEPVCLWLGPAITSVSDLTGANSGL